MSDKVRINEIAISVKIWKRKNHLKSNFMFKTMKTNIQGTLSLSCSSLLFPSIFYSFLLCSYPLFSALLFRSILCSFLLWSSFFCSTLLYSSLLFSIIYFDNHFKFELFALYRHIFVPFAEYSFKLFTTLLAHLSIFVCRLFPNFFRHIYEFRTFWCTTYQI